MEHKTLNEQLKELVDSSVDINEFFQDNSDFRDGLPNTPDFIKRFRTALEGVQKLWT
tara:strand:+ start:2356 stop:2526 length:171 start_codon:yes stop_codon:yes gene_type:complete